MYMTVEISSIKQLIFEQSTALQTEMDFFSQTNDGHDVYSQLKDKHAVVEHINASGAYRDLNQVIAPQSGGSALDVGVAYGLTSAFLAIKGLNVTAVEPSLRLCQDMSTFFQSLGLSVSVVCGIGEVLGQLGNNVFDVVLFNSSLHHCDDMDKALQQAFKTLKPGGRIFLIEPVLKCYRTKKWFYRTLAENPEKLGHYGGNEHIYRLGEYAQSLRKAGFVGVKATPSLNYFHLPQRAPWDSAARYAIKKIYYRLVKTILLQVRPLTALLLRLSLLNPVISAEKPA